MINEEAKVAIIFLLSFGCLAYYLTAKLFVWLDFPEVFDSNERKNFNINELPSSRRNVNFFWTVPFFLRYERFKDTEIKVIVINIYRFFVYIYRKIKAAT